ncbi:MAG: hypothetical protein K0S04_354 [Herbinix sp.]|nr:hypothetical protein [Herbinix sp.]
MKKSLALILCFALFAAVGLTPLTQTQVSAASRASEVINAIGVMETDMDSNASSSSVVTRARFTQMLVNLSTLKDSISNESNVSLFKDVKKSYWASGYIQAAVKQGWITGYLNGTFKPNQGITLQEAVYGVLKLLGYSDSDFTGSKISAIMKLYASKDLDTNITKASTEKLTEGDCINLFYNTLNATNKSGTKYASVLGYTMDSKGNIDYLSLMNKDLEGPIIVYGDWTSKLPFDTGVAKIYKDGKTCRFSDIGSYDVVYYSSNFKTVYVYDDKVTGSVSAINPNFTSPTSVTIGGKDYSFADTDAALKFSAMGNVKKGDIVTIMLGKDGTVVDVLDIDEYNVTMAGYVLSTGIHAVEDKDGDYSVTEYVTFVDASGNEFTQDYDSNSLYLEEGNLVLVKYVDGVASIRLYEAAPAPFTNYAFSSDGYTLGHTALTSDVKILDLKKGKYISINPERLANVNLGSSSILYYAINGNNQISELILNGATGDLDSYGIYTGSTNTNSGITYKYLIDGKSNSLASETGSKLNMSQGPSGFVLENNELVSSYALTGVSVSSIGLTTVQANNAKYTLADKYSVYLYVDKEYVLTTLDKVKNLSKFNVMAYFDKSISLGGRIRVIVATQK